MLTNGIINTGTRLDTNIIYWLITFFSNLKSSANPMMKIMAVDFDIVYLQIKEFKLKITELHQDSNKILTKTQWWILSSNLKVQCQELRQYLLEQAELYMVAKVKLAFYDESNVPTQFDNKKLKGIWQQDDWWQSIMDNAISRKKNWN